MANDTTASSSTTADAEKLASKALKDTAAKTEKKQEEADLPNLGLPDSVGHKGTIAVDGDAPIEGLLLAYQSVSRIAAKISARVIHHDPSVVLMHNPEDYKAIEAVRAFSVETDLLRNDLRRVKEEVRKILETAVSEHNFALTVPVVGAAISSVLQLVSLFREDYKLKYSKIEVEDQVLAVTVAGAIKKAGKAVYNTSLVPLAPKNPQGLRFVALDELKALRSDLVGIGDRLHALIGGQTNASGTNVPAPTPQISEGYAKVVAAVASVDAFLTSLSKINETTNTSRLAQVVAGMMLIDLLDEKAALLWVKAVAAGGGSRSKESTFSSEVTYSGGAIASFALYDRAGKLLEADTVSMYSGFVRNLPEGKLPKFDD